MTVILDIDLDYFALFNQPVRRLEKVLAWAERPVDFMVRHHHEAFRHWRRMAEEALSVLPISSFTLMSMMSDSIGGREK